MTEVLREGAQQLLAEAIETEVAEFLAKYRDARDDAGHRRMVRNGYLPARTIHTGIGEVPVKAPRVRDRAGSIRFTSAILPPYLRRSKTIEELLPWLYLKGISTGEFGEALAALLGRDAPGLSPGTVSRLKAAWVAEHKRWGNRFLQGCQYAYSVDRRHPFQRAAGGSQPAHPGGHRRHRGRKKGAAGTHRGLPGIRGIPEGTPSGFEAPGLNRRPEACRGRWRARVLEGAPAGLRRDTHAEMLGAQDRQHPEQTAEIPATQSEIRPACHLDGGNTRGCASGVRCLPLDLRTEVPKGRRVPVEGPGSAACLLRLPRRALGASAHDEPHRVDLCQRAAAHGENAWMRVTHEHPLYDIQAREKRREPLAPHERS